MKKTVRYEVRWGLNRQSFDNIFSAYEKMDNIMSIGISSTIHEITTLEKDITETAKGRNTTDEATKL